MDKKSEFSLEYDAAFLAFSILKRLDCGDIDNFEKRLKSQKVQYIGQLFGVSPNYSFNLYVHGPYSPALTADLYKFKEFNTMPSSVKFAPDELEERFSNLEKFIKNKSLRQLEIVATLQWLLAILKFNSEAAATKLKKWKGVTEEEFGIANNNLKFIPKHENNE